MNLMNFVVTGLTGAMLSSLRLFLTTKMPDHVPFQYQSGKAPRDDYDFIVVGSGCGGSPVAARLSETGASVLLLEAGAPAPPESAVPGLAVITRADPLHWEYELAPQKLGMFGYHNNASKVQYGKNIGGTSSSYAMVLVRGNRRDFDLWAELGNTGWDYNSVLPYFNKLENYTDIHLPVDAHYHGFQGPVGLMQKPSGPLATAFLRAGQQLGYHTVDHSGPEQIGFYPNYLTVRDGIRTSASESYLTPVKNRPNLDIRSHCTVQKVLFDSSKRAIGVEYVSGGKVHTVRARKEVIISAGPFETPKLLMLSGIGPREHLQEMGIPVIAAVEGVGRNYHDHPVTVLPCAVRKGAGDHAVEMISNLPSLKTYVKNRSGFFAETFGSDAMAFLKLGNEDHPLWTDVLMEVVAFSAATLGGELASLATNAKDEFFEDLFKPLRGHDTMSFIMMLARPKSRGRVTLRSNNIAHTPIADVNVFHNKDDLRLMIKAIRMALRVGDTGAFKKDLQAKFSRRLMRACRHLPRNSDAYWECFARYTVLAGYHAAGTAKMAPDTDPMGVVSPRLSVRGVSGLRVADVSIIPEPVAANTMGPTFMIGEKAADIIKEDWGYPTQPLL